MTRIPSSASVEHAGRRPCTPSTSTTHMRHEAMSLTFFRKHSVGMWMFAARAASKIVEPCGTSTETPSIVRFTLDILDSTPFHSAATEVAATQTTPAFLNRFFTAHGHFDIGKIVLAFTRGAFGNFHAALGCTVVGRGRGNINAAIERVVVAQVLVDVARGNLASANRLNGSRGTGLAVAANEHAGERAVFALSFEEFVCLEFAPFGKHARVFERLRLDALPHRNEDYISFDAALGLVGGLHRRRPPFTAEIICGCVTSATTWPASFVSMESGDSSVIISTPSAMALSISASSAVMSATRRR